MDTQTTRTAETNTINALQEMEDAVGDAGPAPAKASPSRARKSEKPAHAAKPKAAAKAQAGFDPEALAAETRSALEKLEGTVQSLGRKSTAQAFELGSVFEEAGKLLVEDQTFKGWVKQRCGYEDRTARLYRDVHRNLTPWRKRLVDHAVKPTVMFKLATGDEEQVEAIVAEIESGKPLKVKDVVERLKAGAGDDTGAAELGPWDRSGLSGLLAAAKLRAHEDAATFGRVVSAIRSDILHVLAETPDGKRVSKKDLAEKVEYPARHAKAVLEALLCSSTPNPTAPHFIWPIEIPRDSSWARVHQALYTLGGKADWPGSNELRSWFETEVVPALTWALSKDASAPLGEAAPSIEGPEPADDEVVAEVAVPEAEAVEPEAATVKEEPAAEPMV